MMFPGFGFLSAGRQGVTGIRRKIACFIFVFCILFAVTCAYASGLDNVKKYFLKANYTQAIREGEKLMGRMRGDSPGLAELYYILGLSYMKQGNYLRASDIFEIIINEFKDSRYKEDAYIGLGDIDFLQGNFNKAQTQYEYVLKKNPNTKLASLINFRLAQCALKKGKWQEAKNYTDRLNRDFPLSLEAKMVEELSYDKFYFTVQVGSFSKLRNARNLTNRLRDQGYPAYIEEYQHRTKKVYRVRTGKFNSRFQARELEKQLNADGFPTRIYP